MRKKLRLIYNLPIDELVRKLHYLDRQAGVYERVLGFYLLDLQNRNQYTGFQSAAHWAHEKLGIELKDARELIRVADKLEKLHRINRLFSKGKLPWSKVKLIARAASPGNEGRWIRFARNNDTEAVRREVRRLGEDGGAPGSGLGSKPKTFTVHMPLPPLVHETFQQAVRKVRGEIGGGATPAQALAEIARIILGTEPTDGAERRSAPRGPAYTVVIHLTEKGLHVLKLGESAPIQLSTDEIAEVVRSGARVLVARDIHGDGPCAAIPLGQRGSVPPEERHARVTPEDHCAVFARDDYRCQICGSQEDPHIHHLDSWADGGKSTMDRLVCLCAGCNALVHQGLVILTVEGGRLVPMAKDGRKLRGEETAAVALREGGEDAPLTVLEVEGTPGPAAPLPIGESPLAALPEEIPASDWRSLEGRLEPNPARGLFVLGPPKDALPAAGGERKASEETKTAERRPTAFEDFVGQKRAVENVKLLAQAARERGEPAGHVLLAGPPGLGKTTLGGLLATERGTGFRSALGANLDPLSLISVLAGLDEGDVLFIDEIHRLDAKTQEALFTALEDRYIRAVLTEAGSARSVTIRLNRFTLVGATTSAGRLSEPFRARFALIETLEPYPDEDIAEIVSRAAGRLGVSLERGAAGVLALRSRGIPREGLRLLDRARDLAQVAAGARKAPESNGADAADAADAGRIAIEAGQVVEAAARMGIDDAGLTREQRKIVELLLERDRAMGIDALAGTLGIEVETLKVIDEPYLLRRGFVERTERGRRATPKARARYGSAVGRADRGTEPDRTNRPRGIPILNIRCR